MASDILKTVLKRVEPTAEERSKVKKTVEAFSGLLEKAAKQEVFVGGSYAKGTWLSGIADVDIFIRYPLAKFISKSSKLSDILDASLRATFKGVERLHGSRDYFRVNFQNLMFEVVPILKVSNAKDAVNLTDITPLHVSWVKANMDARGRETLLLLKAFLQANRLYGAESYKRGFSGYVCEILSAYFGSFEKMIESVVKWKQPMLIDPARYYKTKDEAMLSLNSSKIGDLVLIDPVQATRNAAAALGPECFTRFVQLAREFSKKPDIKFFTKTEANEEIIRNKHSARPVVWLEVFPLKGKEDVVGAKMLKVFEHLAAGTEKYGFSIIEKGWEWDKKGRAAMWFVFKSSIEKEFEVNGPPLSEKEHVKKFRAQHRRCHENKDRLAATETREFTEALGLIKSLLNGTYVKERITKVEVR